MLLILLALVIIVVVTAFIVRIGRSDLARMAHVAHIAEGVAVVGALIFAIFEYSLHHDADAARKREAATAILARSFNVASVDGALGAVYRDYNPDHEANWDADTFDDKTGSLMSYFSAINACVTYELCSSKTVWEIYCDNYQLYTNEYAKKHGEGQTKKVFGDLHWLNQCDEIPQVLQATSDTQAPSVPAQSHPASPMPPKRWHFP